MPASSVPSHHSVPPAPAGAVSPTTAVEVTPPTRPEEAVRAAAWVDPSSFMSAEQARARDRFLRRMHTDKANHAAGKTEKKDPTTCPSHHSAAPPETVVYPSSAPAAPASPSVSPHATSVPASPPATELAAAHTGRPVFTADEVIIGSFSHEPVEGGGASARADRAHVSRLRRRRRAPPTGVTGAKTLSASPRLARQLLADDRAWGIYSIPPTSYYVAAPVCLPAIAAAVTKHEAARRADIDALLADKEGSGKGTDVRFWAQPLASDDAEGLKARQHDALHMEDKTETTSDVAQGQAGAVPAVTATEASASGSPPVEPYQPMGALDEARQPRLQPGRMLEEQRYKLPRCPPYRIPLFDQACMKYIFPNLFDSDFQFMEMFYWIVNLVLVVVQIVMVVVNVFFNDPQSYILPWVRTASTVIFSVEFGVTMALILFMIITIVHACVTKNVGTKLAQDVAALVTFISTFSVLRAVGLASPSFAMRRIFPQFQHAINFWDVLIGFGMIIVWLAACLLAFLTLIIKVTQIDFTYSVSITDWTFAQFVQLIGLLMNLARVDDSYYKETSVLLDTVHHHFSTPGDPREAQSMEKPCLLARVMRLLHIPNYMYYEYFDTIFNYHMDWARFENAQDSMPLGAGATSASGEHGQLAVPRKKKKTYNLAYEAEKTGHVSYTFDDIPMAMKWRNMLNYLSFVFEIDTIQLRRYLQMVQSPLPFYRVGRDAYLMSFADGDPVGMDMAVWRSDPIAGRTRRYAKMDSSQFNLGFVCDDRRDVWDPNYKTNAVVAETQRAAAFGRAMDEHKAAATSAAAAREDGAGTRATTCASSEPVEAEEGLCEGGEEMSPVTGANSIWQSFVEAGEATVAQKNSSKSKSDTVVLDRRLFFNPQPHAKHDKYDEDIFVEQLNVKPHLD